MSVTYLLICYDKIHSRINILETCWSSLYQSRKIFVTSSALSYILIRLFIPPPCLSFFHIVLLLLCQFALTLLNNNSQGKLNINDQIKNSRLYNIHPPSAYSFHTSVFLYSNHCDCRHSVHPIHFALLCLHDILACCCYTKI